MPTSNIIRWLGLFRYTSAVCSILACLAFTASAQNDPCVPAYRLSACAGDPTCKAEERRRWAREEAECRAKKNSSASSTSSSGSRPSSAPARSSSSSGTSYYDSARAARERATREEAERARERSRAFSEQKKKGQKGSASTAEIRDSSADSPDERTRAYNAQKAKQRAAMRPQEPSTPVYSDGSPVPKQPDWTDQRYSDEKIKKLGLDKKGKWKTAAFEVTWVGRTPSSDGLFIAAITNERGNRTPTGSYLHIKNDGKEPIFFGMSGVLNDELGPYEEKLIYLPIYRSSRDKRNTKLEIKVKYWVP